MSHPSHLLLTLPLRRESDLVAARQRARQVAALLGLAMQDQTRVATAVAEICRNAIRYAGGGLVEFELAGDQTLTIRVRDHGTGIAHPAELRSGTHPSPPGPGLGITRAERLVDSLDVQSAIGQGTTVTLRKRLPAGSQALDATGLERDLARHPPDAASEPDLQSRELLASLTDLRGREDELQHLNRELEETNRGVVALYAELDERADRLRRADETKSRFLSHLSHEFRTPVNSIRALARLLLDRVDGSLTGEQERQVRFIRQAAETLTELLDDVLDLGRIEAGRVEVAIAPIELRSLFGTLRGLFKPLAANPDVRLLIEDPSDFPVFRSDETKLAQILRNLVSNALKFTERGEVRVEARHDRARGRLELDVIDSGIGIAPEHRDRIFEEYAQLEHALQRRVKGTGLGLALSRRLAEMLGGSLTLADSEVGRGSRFRLTLPLQPPRTAETLDLPAAEAALRGQRVALVVEDDEASRYLLRRPLEREGWTVHEAADAASGHVLARSLLPTVVFLDLNLPDAPGESVLERLQIDEATRQVPVIIVTSRRLSADQRAALRATDVWQKEDLHPDSLLPRLRSALPHLFTHGPAPRAGAAESGDGA